MPVSLAERLRERIRREGAISFHDWMKAALYDPDGYYQRSDRTRWGREGDYRTSPERSELFAATFAHYFVGLSEENLTIVEFGVGDGSFAAGVLSTLREQEPSIFARVRYVVMDVSDDALSRAREQLAEFGDRIEFYSDWSHISVGRGVYFANELFDAFPVHRVLKTEAGLSEFYVSVDANDRFTWTTGPLSTPRLNEFCNSLELANGQVIEINLGIDDWFAEAATRLDQGFVISVDYGAEAVDLYDPAQRPEGSLRGFFRHEFVADLLSQPGEFDLTTTVNWTQIKTAGERHGFHVIDFASQDKFLLKAGLLDQLEFRLSKVETEAEKSALTIGAREMILPGGMASSFQVLVQKRS
ncbi:MAG TPA: SAM-dependent methyltransferase [Pyrinomonadaceae bacterium]|nr:SAM-dependent methyltransferase [Pyrinomonadaceae bacterium]